MTHSVSAVTHITSTASCDAKNMQPQKKLGGPRLNGATPGGSEAGKRVSNGTVETMLNHKVGIMKLAQHNINITLLINII